MTGRIPGMSLEGIAMYVRSSHDIDILHILTMHQLELEEAGYKRRVCESHNHIMRRSTLEVHEQILAILDIVIITWIYMEKKRRERAAAAASAGGG